MGDIRYEINQDFGHVYNSEIVERVKQGFLDNLDPHVYFAHLAIAPLMRNRGIGATLVEETVERMREINFGPLPSIWVEELSIFPTGQFWEKRGFEPVYLVDEKDANGNHFSRTTLCRML